MDKTSTSTSSNLENLLRKAVLSGCYGSPSENVLEFIRNFSITSRNSELMA